MNMNKIEIGDCFELIKNQPDNSVDLIITSPPYADIMNYGESVSVKNPDSYVDWILPLFSEIHRVLKPSGSFILNINDKVNKNKFRNTYIYDLISRNNKETNLKLYDTYFWHKKNGIPNGSKKRFRNTTEFIFHFCKNPDDMKFYIDRILIEKKSKAKVSSGAMPEKTRPDNVFRFNTAGASKDNDIKHPAPFNKELPLYFINFLTDIGDLVLDPFSGIGTTGLACMDLDRNYIGYELNENYGKFSVERLNGEINHFSVINQYDLNDNFIQSYSTLTEAATNLNLGAGNIRRCISMNGYETCGGFKFKLETKIKSMI